MAIGPVLPDGTVTRTVRRADLYGALYDLAVSRGVPIEHGKRLVAADSAGGQVTATFADGSSATGDVLIGADGLRSAVRTLIDPQPRSPATPGWATWAASPGRTTSCPTAVITGWSGGNALLRVHGQPGRRGVVVRQPAVAQELTRRRADPGHQARRGQGAPDRPAVRGQQPGGPDRRLHHQRHHRRQPVRHPARARLAPRPDDHHRRRGPRGFPQHRPGRVARQRRRGDAGPLPARRAGQPGCVRRLRAAAPGPGRARGRLGRQDGRHQDGRAGRADRPRPHTAPYPRKGSTPEAMDKQAWMFSHHIDWTARGNDRRDVLAGQPRKADCGGARHHLRAARRQAGRRARG